MQKYVISALALATKAVVACKGTTLRAPLTVNARPSHARSWMGLVPPGALRNCVGGFT